MSITAVILHALVAQASAKDVSDPMANVDMDDLADKFINKLFDRLSGTTLDDADIDQTTLASLGLKQPMLSRGLPARFPQPMQNNFLRGMPRSPVQALQASKKDLPQNKIDMKGLSKAAIAAGALAPLGAHAAELTPSLQNLLNSVVAGGVVAGAIAGAVIAVSQFDPVSRG